MSTIAATNLKNPSSASNNIVLDSSGRVGIGTSPSVNLDVFGAINLRSQYNLTWGGAYGAGIPTIVGDSSASYIAVYPAGSTSGEKLRVDSSGNLKFDSGYGSAATAYGCRAWVNFNGTGTVAIRASGNVSSITDNGTGDYTVNFTSALADANYAGVVSAGDSGVNSPGSMTSIGRDVAVSYFRFYTNQYTGPAVVDRAVISVAIFR